MDSTLRLLMVAAAFGAIFVVPLVAVILFVQSRAKKRRAALVGPWSALAQRWGGALVGEKVFCERGDHRLVLEMNLVSVMQAASGPYYPDGGTFTCARLAVAPGLHLAQTRAPARVDGRELATHVPAAGFLPPDARVVLAPNEAVVVLPGAVSDPARLDACFQLLDAIVQNARARGPLAIAPAA